MNDCTAHLVTDEKKEFLKSLRTKPEPGKVEYKKRRAILKTEINKLYRDIWESKYK